MDNQQRELVEVYNVTTAVALQVVSELAAMSPVLPSILYKEWVLERLVGLSKEQADRYLSKHGYGKD